MTSLVAALLVGVGSGAHGAPQEIEFREALVIPSVGQYGRRPVHTDAIEAQIVAGTWEPPHEGDAVEVQGAESRTWATAMAADNGWIAHNGFRGGYAYVAIDSLRERVMILDAVAHSTVYVNGEPRYGDPYQTGFVRVPVLLKKGRNDFLFHCFRGRFRAKLVVPDAPVMFNTRDATLPDLIVGEEKEVWGAVVVINATDSPLRDLRLSARLEEGPSQTTAVPFIPPLSVRKVGFRIPASLHSEPGSVDINLELLADEGPPLSSARVGLRVRCPTDVHKRTFISAIDGSVQYYAVNPARPLTSDAPPPALVITCHGAGVEALGQASAYSSKTWAHIVAPTNRRPFGFDWEDWGRLDTLEVMRLAQESLKTDPSRVYLTGHSMGGHGAWHLGVTFPGRFAAIGPSAGWISFWSYAGAVGFDEDDPVQAILKRAVSPSDTLALARNFLNHGVYILHGEKDDNVPPGQARRMREELAKFHRDFDWHEQPGAGHWWDSSDEPGTDCVDWAPMFDFFARRAIPPLESVRNVEFVTANPGVSATCRWVTIEAQIRHGKPSSVKIRFDPGRRRFVGETENVERLSLSVRHLPPGESISLQLDGWDSGAVPWPDGEAVIRLERRGESWAVAGKPPPSLKGPHRYGPFKDAFRSRMLFVYATQGTPEENAWAFAKARYDAETFWYRGNGSVDVVPDTDFDPAAEPDRNVIVYGNRNTNGAWNALLGESPVQVGRGAASTGGRLVRGDSLACLFIRPRRGSDVASVGVVSGTGIAGMRLTDRIPYFVSGIGYPDCIVIGPEALEKGMAGVRVAGFFGTDWSVNSGEFAWRE
ncbi:MAG: prolyl oligopeptidase family serine peptidase [Armatimonadetes bacterium]|nr:prolyl oligopeptidase family serine peptidase [Armatimonadota bacterium]